MLLLNLLIQFLKTKLAKYNVVTVESRKLMRKFDFG